MRTLFALLAVLFLTGCQNTPPEQATAPTLHTEGIGGISKADSTRQCNCKRCRDFRDAQREYQKREDLRGTNPGDVPDAKYEH